MAERTGECPTALTERPELFPDLEPVARAFALLTRSRPLATGPGMMTEAPIPLSEIESYCRLFGDSDPEELTLLLCRMDDAYLKARSQSRDDRSSNRTFNHAAPPIRD